MKRLFLLTFLLFLTSCELTQKLWNSSYEDEIRNFITTRNGYEVAFIGDKYHYLLYDNRGLMKSLLFWYQRRTLYVDPKESFLRVDAKNNNVQAHIVVRTFVSKLPFADQEYLKSLGFVRSKDVGFVLRLDMPGRRFLSNNVYYSINSLNRSYKLSVYYDNNNSLLGTIRKVTLSPITMALDSLILVRDVIYIPLGRSY